MMNIRAGKVAKNRAANLFQAHRRLARKNPDSLLRCAADLRQADFYPPLGLVGTPEKSSRRILFADAKNSLIEMGSPAVHKRS